jgi:hypothetical protein
VEHSRVLVRATAKEMVLFEVEFDPPPRWALPGFPTEDALVLVAGTDDPAAVPLGRARQWHHRYPRESLARVMEEAAWPIPLVRLVGGLCLWYPKDPQALQWTWGRGFDDYVRILQRHFWCEEFWRRTGIWPIEDAPHGFRTDGEPHSILSEELRRAS